MKPSDAGLPFDEWRPYQVDALLDVQGAGRFVGLSMPTGSGKSAVYMAMANLCGGRSVVLTSTKGLQDQLTREFTEAADIRGKANYLCNLESPRVPVPEGICQVGLSCALKGGGCEYFDAYRAALASRVVVTNYALWLSINEYAEGLGAFDQLILDESHNAHDELSDFLSVEIADWELDSYLWERKLNPNTHEWFRCGLEWGFLVEQQIHSLRRELEIKRTRAALQRVKELSSLKVRVERVALLTQDEKTVLTVTDGGGYSWTPVDIMDQNHILFRGIKKVVFVSATMREKTMEMLGIKNPEFIEFPSTFPLERRKVIYVPTVRVQHNMTPAEMHLWVDRIDQIIERNLDRKGIIHTVSYKRRDYLMQKSRYSSLMITHARKNAAQKVREFKRSKAPSILVSPAMTTGWDFPYQECEYQIIAKVPFPNMTDPVVQARTANDKMYGHYLATVELVQAAGRGMRAADDQCTTYVIDDHFDWFQRKMKRFAPKWFMESVHNVATIPKVLPPLRRR